MYPHERSLVKRLANQPFVLIGINSDGKPRMRKAMKENNITWRSFWDGGNTSGPIATAWGVRGWPTIYVVDDRGVIRYKNVRGKKMDEAVDTLLARATVALAAGLKSDDESTRGLAAYRMGKYRADGAVKAITPLLEDESALVRQRAATGLALLAEKVDPALLPLLRQAAADREASVRSDSLVALGRASDRKSIAVVVEALGDKNSDVQRAAISSAGALKATEAVTGLSALTASQDDATSRAAIAALGAIGGKAGTGALKVLAKKPDHPARVRIAAALFQAGDKASGKRFREFLADDAVAVRRDAVTAISTLKGLDTRPLFLVALKDKDFDVRLIARKALQDSKDRKVRKALREAVLADVADLVPRLASQTTQAQALLQLKSLGADVAPLLVEQLKNSELNRNARSAVERVLAQASGDVVPAVLELLEAEQGTVRISGVRILILMSKSDSKQARAALTKALQDDELHVRAWAAYGLSQQKDKVAVPVLVKLLQSTDSLARQIGVLGLSSYKTKETSDAIAAGALKNSVVGRMAVAVLQQQETADAARALGRLLREGNQLLKTQARGALSQMSTPEAKKVLKEADKASKKKKKKKKEKKSDGS